jgi:hypothetical protein
MKITYFFKSTNAHSHETAHIYEHIFVSSFRQQLIKNGLHLGLFGWIHGKTYNDTILIECAFYDPKAEKLFYDFMRQSLEITDEKIESAISIISSEYGSSVEIANKAKLAEDLKKLSALPFCNLEEQDIIKSIEPNAQGAEPKTTTVCHKQDNFIKTKIVFTYAGKNLNNLAIIPRLWPILADNVAHALNQTGGYVSALHFPEFNDNDCLTMRLECNFRAERCSPQQIIEDINNLKKTINFIQLKPELEKYITAFKNSDRFAHAPEEIMDDTGILVSRHKIAALFTPENVQRVWNKLELDIT